MSISDAILTDFDRWIVTEFSKTGAFTALVVLIEIADDKVTPLCSTYFNVIGDDVDWSGITVLFAGAGREWDGAAFFPNVAPFGGPLDNSAARLQLRGLEERLDDDRLVLNEGHCFDKWGRRMRIEEVEEE
ncbi:hypothetical protein [Tardiphaga sp. 768_D3_N2_1]|uniref:hypothetical protein n=1 Tax=Tardiphaga sp. 768_D3_N2_1 TaxID=3240783 RepID=UPI003F88A5E1